MTESVEMIDKKNPYTLTWFKLSVCVKQKSEESSFWKKTKYKKVQILQNVSGVVSNGTLLAIMGPSGAGKTTLLATIACRLKDMVSGEVRLNGRLVSRELMKKISAFIPQCDTTFEYITVLEHLNFMATLKMDRRLTKVDRQRKVQSLMTSLSLNKCSSTYLKNLSGGERKRVTLATQMLVDPLIMFCDEPTSGLDSYNTQTVVVTLQRLARRGKIVICSIHQPTSHIFEMFDEVVLIASEGRLAYQGKTTHSAEYFARLNMTCPMNYNIAEFLVSKISVSSNENHKQLQALCDMFDLSEAGKQIDKRIKSTYTETITKEKEFFMEILTKKHATVWTQFWCLLYRYILESLRNNTEHMVNLIGFLAIGVTFGLFYYKHEITDQKSIQDIQGLMFLLIVELVYQYGYHVVFSFQIDMPILLREVNDGLYTPGPYYLSQIVAKISYAFLEPLIYACIVYYCTDIFVNVSFVQYALVFSITAIMSVSYGMFLSSIFDSMDTLSLFCINYESIAYLCSGVSVNLNTVGTVFQYLKYISIFYYGVESLSIIQWNSVHYIPCDDECGDTNCISNGIEVLKKYGYKTEGYIYNIIGMLILTVALNTVAFGIIWKRAKQQAVY